MTNGYRGRALTQAGLGVLMLVIFGLGGGLPGAVLQGQTLADSVSVHEQACDSGYMPGCTNLGTMYMDGSGVPQDLGRAVSLAQQACDSGYMPGCTNLGTMYMDGSGVAQDLVRAVSLLQQACDGGNMMGCNNLGNAYMDGSGVPQDLVRAVSLYQQACDGGQVMSCYNLGNTYMNGSGVPQDLDRALSLFQQACDGGVLLGCNNLGFMYANGSGVIQDLVRAVSLYQQACDGGEMTGCTNLEIELALEILEVMHADSIQKMMRGAGFDLGGSMADLPVDLKDAVEQLYNERLGWETMRRDFAVAYAEEFTADEPLDSVCLPHAAWQMTSPLFPSRSMRMWSPARTKRTGWDRAAAANRAFVGRRI